MCVYREGALTNCLGLTMEMIRLMDSPSDLPSKSMYDTGHLCKDDGGEGGGEESGWVQCCPRKQTIFQQVSSLDLNDLLVADTFCRHGYLL